MEEILIKSHLIVSDVHEEYEMKWVGKIKDVKPKIENGKPIFIIVGNRGRHEINTVDMERIEKCAKSLTYPRGRQAITSDVARIYIKEIDDNEKIMGYLIHNHIKTFTPMFDKVGWR